MVSSGWLAYFPKKTWYARFIGAAGSIKLNISKGYGRFRIKGIRIFACATRALL
jgi:hypothetical protein